MTGPLTWAVAMERPEEASETLIPDLGSFRNMISPADTSSSFRAGSRNSTATLQRADDNDHRLGWVVGAGANINLADIATFTAGAQYTKGLTDRWINQLSPDVASDAPSR